MGVEMKTVSCLILAGCLLGSLLCAETFPVPQLPFGPRVYNCQQSTLPLKIDGRDTETDWAQATWSEYFTDIEGDLKPAPYLNTRVKMLWDQTGLYIFARMEEPHIWAKLLQHDSVIFQDNDFEVFLDPNGDTHEYFELELNALGTLWDLFLIKPYRDAHSSLNGWEAKGLRYAIGLEGTLNDPSDTDQAWCVELFMPWSAVSEMAHTPCPPQPGDYWRINFSRVQWETDIVAGEYVKVPDKPEFNWVWSPQGLVAMHYPERWGYLFFVSGTSGSVSMTHYPPQVENAREYLRQIYYAQKQFWLDHGRYSDSLAELGMPIFSFNAKSYTPRLETTSRSFLITLQAEGFPDLYITEDGRLFSN